MRQQLRHFEQNLNLKSILQETSDNATLESRDEDRFFFRKEKKGLHILHWIWSLDGLSKMIENICFVNSEITWNFEKASKLDKKLGEEMK